MSYVRLKYYFLFVVFTINVNNIYSQENNSFKYERRRNILKVNLTSLALKNYQFQAERVLTRTISISFTYANLPEGDVPLKNQILNLLQDQDDEVASILNSAQIGYTSYIPEVRFYLGKGYGKGVYLAPFYKYSKYKIRNAEILEYERDDGSFEALVTNGDVSANTFGLLLGAQFNLGRRIVLDWWIMGPNFGTHSGELSGATNRPLSPSEQLLLKNQLEDINVPLSETTFEIASSGVEMVNKGNWGG